VAKTKDVPSTRPLAAKLGIKPGFAVCVLGAPQGFAALLAPLPGGVTLSARAAASAQLFVVFVRQARELDVRLAELASLVERQTLWLAWPKQVARIPTDLNGNVVRGLDSPPGGWITRCARSIPRGRDWRSRRGRRHKGLFLPGSPAPSGA
jgi:hypothetical protein